MAISSDDANITIEFTWQSDEDDDLQLHVKHHKVNGTPTVSVSDDGVNWYHFPTAFFQEVTDFLAKQKLLKKPTPTQSSFKTQEPVSEQSEQPNQPLGSIMSQDPGGGAPVNSPLPTPQVSDADEADAGENEQQFNEPVELADTSPVESFTGLAPLGNNTTVSKQKSQEKSRRHKASQSNEEIIDRPVLRDADSETAAQMRAAQSGKGPSVKRAEG